MDLLIPNMEMPKENEKVVLILQSNGEVTICGDRLLTMAFSSPGDNSHGLVLKKTKAIEIPRYLHMEDLHMED